MRIITGLQPSGKLHVGNYFGAMEPAVRMQESGESFYFLADYHAMSTVHDANTLRENCSNLATDFLAVGLDPEKCVFFRQSAVPEVNELAWILSTVCPMGLLERCHSYKDKIAKGFSPSNALFTYPVLMAADILMYDSDLVPVGKDQKQHLEVTRDLAGKMNEQFGEGTCKLPDALIAEITAIVPGLDGQKMSKSYNNTLPIFGEEKAVRKLIMRIPTDSTPVEDPKPTEGSVILQLYKLFASAQGYEDMVRGFQNGGCGYGDFKKRLFDAYWEYFRPARERRAELEQAKQPQQKASETPKGAAPVHERPVTAKQPEDFRHHAGKPAMQPASLSIRERGQVPYGETVAEQASVPVVKAASIHHEQTPPVRTERQIIPSASLSQPNERQKTAPTITQATPRPARPVQNDTAPVIPERKRAAPAVKESNFTIRRTTARKEWTKTVKAAAKQKKGEKP